MKRAAMEMEEGGWSGANGETDGGPAHPAPGTHPKDAWQVLGWGVDNIRGQDRGGRELGVPGRFMEQVRGHTAPGCPPNPLIPCPVSLPGTHLRSSTCRRAPLAGLSRGSGASNSSRRESLRVANTRCQPRRTPEGRGTYGEGRHGRACQAQPAYTHPHPASAHRQEALVGSAPACFRVHSQGHVEEVGGHGAGRSLWGTSRVTEVAADCGESGRSRWCEAGWGRPRTRTLGIPSPSFPEAMGAPERSPIPRQVRKQRKTQQWAGLINNMVRQVQGHSHSSHLGLCLVHERWGCGQGARLTVTAQALAAQAQHQRRAVETLGRRREAPETQHV